jgi:hypothetical protein
MVFVIHNNDESTITGRLKIMKIIFKLIKIILQVILVEFWN